jgi:hypothetical protein
MGFREDLLSAGTANLPILRHPAYAYLLCDQVAVAAIPSGYIELTALVMQYEFRSQEFHRVNDPGLPPDTFQTGPLSGETIMVANGAIRFLPDMALQAMAALAEQLVKAGVKTKAEIVALVDQKTTVLPD